MTGTEKGIYQLLNEMTETINRVRDLVMEAEKPRFKVVTGLRCGKTHIFSDMYKVPGELKEINEKFDWAGSERGVSL